MTNLVSEHLTEMYQHRLNGLDLGGNFIYPNYNGHSVLNIPTSICRILGAPGIGADALNDQVLGALHREANRVILILMDALALHRLQRWMEDGTTPVWRTLAEDGILAPLTSITPSTTSAALTSFWTGQSAAVHGIVGYEMWLKEYGVVANTILHAPITFQGDVGSLTKAGFNPTEFMPLPTLGEHLAEHNISTYAFQHRSIARSGLSQMFLKKVSVRAFNTASDLWINVRQLVENRSHERQYIWVYWGVVDQFGHLYGPDDERTASEFAAFSNAFERFFLQRLASRAREDTLLILTADHGQIATHKDPHYDLNNHHGLTRRLHILPSGENRMAYLFIRPGQTEAVREYIERTWPNQFALLEVPYAVEKGLFGPGDPHPRLLDRLGEYILVAREHAYLWWSEKDNHLLGRHGGLHPEEMLVPFLVTRI